MLKILIYNQYFLLGISSVDHLSLSTLHKQAQEVIFSRKTVKVSHPSITFNTVPVARTACQKHLGLYLDEKLNFHDHINAKILKANKEIRIIKWLSNTLPRKSL